MKKDKTQFVSIVLPCTGRSASFNPPYSKELVRINEDMSVIDSSFEHILASRVKSQVIVITGPHGSDIVRYVYEKYNDKVDLVFVSQKTNYKKITDVIRSAKHLFGNKNIILVPSGVIEYKDKMSPLIDKILNTLDSQPFAFMYKDESSAMRLKLSGAIRVEGGKVLDLEDKPDKNVRNYNAFWVSYGFKKKFASEVMSVIEQSTLKKADFKKVFKKSPIYGSSAVRINDYTDISTWTNLNAYLLKQYLIKSGVDPQFLKIDQ